MKSKTLLKSETLEGIVLSLVVVIFLVCGIGVCSGFAQSMQSDPNFPVQVVKNAGKVINVAPNVNVNAKAVPMRTSINSPFAELKPAFAPNGERLYFSRVNHPNNTGGENDQEDIWYSLYDSMSTTWSEPIRMPGYLNNEGPNFIENVSKTGDTIVLGNQYLRNGKMRDGVSYSVNKNGEWTYPTPINIKNDYNMSAHGNHFVDLKLRVIISSVQRDESYGHRDLYVSFWNGKYATEPINMGGILNTEFEESSTRRPPGWASSRPSSARCRQSRASRPTAPGAIAWRRCSLAASARHCCSRAWCWRRSSAWSRPRSG
jgi:hypothetical protein